MSPETEKLSDRNSGLVVNVSKHWHYLKSDAFKITLVTEYTPLLGLMVPLKGFAVQMIFFLQDITSNHTKGNYF